MKMKLRFSLCLAMLLVFLAVVQSKSITKGKETSVDDNKSATEEINGEERTRQDDTKDKDNDEQDGNELEKKEKTQKRNIYQTKCNGDKHIEKKSNCEQRCNNENKCDCRENKEASKRCQRSLKRNKSKLPGFLVPRKSTADKKKRSKCKCGAGEKKQTTPGCLQASSLPGMNAVALANPQQRQATPQSQAGAVGKKKCCGCCDCCCHECCCCPCCCCHCCEPCCCCCHECCCPCCHCCHCCDHCCHDCCHDCCCGCCKKSKSEGMKGVKQAKPH